MFLWTFYFLLGVNQVSISGAIAEWYWTFEKSKRLYFPVLRSFGRTLLYSLGSIAVGSLLIALVEFVRVLLYQLQRKAGKEGPQYLKYLVACLQCCMAAVSAIVKYINRNAYVYLSIKGTGFFKSAGESTALLTRNAIRTVAVDFVSDFILFFSKLIVTGVMALFAYMYMVYQGQNLGVINVPIFTAFLVGIEAFIISSAFFGIYQMAIDTIFLSFLMDLEINDGSVERPYFMSQELKEIVSVSRLFPKSRKISTVFDSQEIIYKYYDI
jgi:solute carrier family 44 (choline transporter-like protein), member 2/4/5